MDFLNWKKEFKLYLGPKESAATCQIANKRLSLREPITVDQQQTLDSLRLTATDALRDLFLGIGSEGFRKFDLKSGWDFDNLAQHTLDDALAICDGLFREKQHPV
ncbi:MAG: hypothetical protein GY696_39845, partial [Gammaproteobacteria bacterium]|nr:hypothetical protein [Gammaproteobacteria bacterium]